MIEFDTEETLRNVSNRERVCEFICQSKKKYGLENDIVLSETFANYVRRYVWSKKDFDFPPHVLDKLSQVPSKLGNYNSWLEFSNLHEVTPAAQNASKYLSRPFYDYSKENQQEVSASVEMRLAKMYDRYKNTSHSLKQPVTVDEEDRNITRVANINDIKLIADLAYRVYPCPINDFNVKKPWHQKNKNIFVVCIDEYGELLSNVNLLPITLSFYNKLKSGKIYEDKISPEDILSVSEKNDVECIYVEGYACISIDVQRDFRRRFEKMLSKLAKTKSKELTICAIGGSPEGDMLMQKYKFLQTGWAIDPRSDTKYPFLEVKWHILKKTISSYVAQSENIK